MRFAGSNWRRRSRRSIAEAMISSTIGRGRSRSREFHLVVRLSEELGRRGSWGTEDTAFGPDPRFAVKVARKSVSQRGARIYAQLTPSVAILRNVRSSGVPMMRIMCNSWSWLSRPRKRGTPEIISANIHPQDQTSMEVLYVLDPMRTSGARYHSVTTWSCR